MKLITSGGRTLLLYCLLVSSLSALAAAPLAAPARTPAATTGGTAAEAGFIASFRARPGADGRLPLLGLAGTTAAPGPRLAERDPGTDWQLRWLDAEGRVLGDTPLPDPTRSHRGNADPSLPLQVRFADAPRAVLAELRDAQGRLRGEIPLDAAARAAAEHQRQLGRLRLEAASRRAATKRGTDPVALMAEARQRLGYQIAVQERLRRLREARCPPGPHLLRVPERVAPAQACVQDAAAPVPPVAAELASGVLRPVRGLAPKAGGDALLLPPRRPRADEVQITGRLVFPDGATLPTNPITVYAWGAPGGGYGYVLQAQPPNFQFQSTSLINVEVSLQVVSPAPWLPVTVDLGLVTANVNRDIPMEAGVTVSGRIRFPAGSTPPTSDLWLYYSASGNSGAVSTSPPDFAYAVTVPAGASVDVDVYPPEPFFNYSADWGVISADTTRDITLERGVVLSGRLLAPAGQVLPAPGSGSLELIAWDHQQPGYGNYLTVDPADFSWSLVARAGMSPRLEARVAAPFRDASAEVGPMSTDREFDLRIPRGVLVRGSVSAEGGPMPASYQVWVKDVLARSSRSFSFTTPTFEVAVAPRGGVVEVTADGHFPSQSFQPANGLDADASFVLRPRAAPDNVVLTLRDPQGQALPNARAEAWRGGRYFASALSDAGGIAKLELPDGDYELRVWPDTEQANQWSWESTRLFAEPAIRAPLAVAGTLAQTLQVAAGDWLEMRVPMPTEAPWPGCGATPHGRLELIRDGQVVARGNFRQIYPASGGTGHKLITGPGIYTLRYVMPGEVRYLSAPFVAEAGRSISLVRDGAVPQRLWTGTLRTHSGIALANRDIGVSDELGITTWPGCRIATDAGGRFRLPLCEGCLYEFRGVGELSSQRRIVSIDEPVRADREQDQRLDPPLAFAPLAATGASRVFGRADAPFRLIFLAEGYAAERETYTDSNGNGLWDGVQIVDRNGNGVWDSGEPYAVYGAAPAPTAGQDPRTLGEVFQDLNGDGVLSLDDRALFERNVRDYLRGLFSSREFAGYRHAYQAGAVMAYSAQVGMDDGSVQRDTLFGAAFVPDRGLISIDYAAAGQAAAEASPGYTVVVVMINQPVPYGRVNSYVLASGGVLGGDVNDNVAGHEFGHNPGGLADEYSEFASAWIGTDFNSPNSTRFVERGQVAWGHHVAPELDGRPGKPWLAKDGFFEGSSYRIAGAFRPSQASMMRFMDSLRFNAASVDQLRKVHAQALRGRDGLLQLSGTGTGCGAFAAQWDASSYGVDAVELRAGAMDGPVLGIGGTTGSLPLKPLDADVYLVDAATGTVLDIEEPPIVRCTQSDRAKPAPGQRAPAPVAEPAPAPRRRGDRVHEAPSRARIR